ncbi:MAG: helix-turn-helix transcriptional regulator [Spirosoma sp.]|nr:helix-turn-helix transcriptional regulator [Spirosoma sp.]
MTNVYEFLKYQPETYRQFVFKDLLIARYDCPQTAQRAEIFTHHSYLTFVISGNKWIHRQGKTWLFSEGSLEFVKKGAFIQEVYLDKGFRSLACYIPDGYLQQLIRHFRQFYQGKFIVNQPTEPIIQLATNETTLAFVQTILDFFEQEVTPAEGVVEERFQEFFYSLLINPTNLAFVGYLNSLADRPRASVYDVLEANYMHPLSLIDYARMANCSLATFKREFRKLFTTTPAHWLIQKRLDFALVLLKTTDKSIGDIGFESGFENNAHFSRVFKERFGESPLQYRRQYGLRPAPMAVSVYSSVY